MGHSCLNRQLSLPLWKTAVTTSFETLLQIVFGSWLKNRIRKKCFEEIRLCIFISVLRIFSLGQIGYLFVWRTQSYNVNWLVQCMVFWKYFFIHLLSQKKFDMPPPHFIRGVRLKPPFCNMSLNWMIMITNTIFSFFWVIFILPFVFMLC